MASTDECLFIKLPARAENLAVVRHAVGNVARQLGMIEPGVADLQLVVTEACANVVVHAYPDGPGGPLEVEASREADELDLVVRDQGTGFDAPTVPKNEGLRLGMALISTLANSVDVFDRAGGGTEVCMRLPFPAGA
jgi:anti-sigma regulatory factor (Ser/Thr protein kinase)